MTIALEISSDGGSTWSVSATTLSGDHGANIATGTGKTIIWNAGTDWNEQVSPQMKFRVTADDLEPEGFALIPAGPFQMGDQSSPRVGVSWELPVHTVQVSAFYLAKYEATKELWDEVRAWGMANGYTDLAVGNGSYASKGANHPVHSITWYDMVKWCNARSHKEGMVPCYTVAGAVYKTGQSAPLCNWAANGYRLPTEAEWEKAARGGLIGLIFPCGDTINHSNANFNNNGGEPYQTGTTGYHPTYAVGEMPYSSPVGSFAPNGFGLYDMVGNMSERCWDWDGTYTASSLTDPRGPASGTSRLHRCSSWFNSASSCRAAYRNGYHPSYSNNSIGFRPARSSIPPLVDPATGDIIVDTHSVTLTLTPPPAVQGSLSGAGGYPKNATVTVTAAPAAGYLFSGWSGDATGTTNPLQFTMDTYKTISAIFTPDLFDADEDGLTAYDELAIYGTDATKADTDGDGLTDAWEVGLGRFSIVAGSFTWEQARADARAKGGELACLPSQARWDRAMQSIGPNAPDPYDGLWIGASDAATEGTWTWVNGEPFSFNLWAPSRPSSTTGNTLDYAEISGGGGAEIGKWYDRSPTTVRDGYLLETGYATDPLVADADGDGLNDSEEQAAGTNPFLADTDGDGLTDFQEVNLTHTNPLLKNSDGIGPDDGDKDLDADGLTNLEEINRYGTNPLLADTDGDGLSDGFEVHYPGSFFKPVLGTFTYAQAAADAATRRGRIASFPNAADYARAAAKARRATQGYLWLGLSDAATEGTWLWTDGSTATYSRWLAGEPSGGAAENHAVIMENTTLWADTMAEYVTAGYVFERVGLDPLDPDTDGDGLSDGEEVNTTLSDPMLEDTDGDGLLDGAEVNIHGSNPNLVDTDGDGLNDRLEVEIYHTNPNLKDSDGDGFDDLFEVNTGFDPASAASTPDALSSIRTAVEFRFNAASGVSYRVEASTDLNAWSTIEPKITGEGGVVTRFYSIENHPKRYFRVRRN